MITLNSVTKIVGRKDHRIFALNEVDWSIPPQSRFVIFGQQHACNRALLDIISGMQLPTSGWVERRGVVSVTTGLLRATGTTTPRQLVHRLARIYQADPKEIAHFVEELTNARQAMDAPIRLLPKQLHMKLSLALFYGLPCDYYLYDGYVNFGPKDFAEQCRAVFAQRQDHAGMILVTSFPRAARDFGGMGGVLHKGKLYFLDTMENAIAVHEQLQIDFPDRDSHRLQRERAPDQEEGEVDLI